MIRAELKAWRKAQGLTVQGLAKRLRTTAKKVDSWESGSARIPDWVPAMLADETLTRDKWRIEAAERRAEGKLRDPEATELQRRQAMRSVAAVKAEEAHKAVQVIEEAQEALVAAGMDPNSVFPDGPPAHVIAPITEAQRRTVSAMIAYGIPLGEVAACLDMSVARLKDHFEGEIAKAKAQANARVAENLFKKATGDGSQAVQAATFWLKSRAGWADPVQRVAVGGDAEAPPVKFEQASESILAAIEHVVRNKED
jgi:transcriptional regulator with XRE-family HTH domain